ncbi:glycosyltransferase family 2 protein [Paenibacillus sp. GCM10023252]|uniref:glycosyltransferase family 2 protein n=1 Tax=Paenibacillus sp. GCM10023252 TaxID=3252649 RepID=UPI003607984B
MMVDLGIVMPVYKQKPEFLQAAIQSILKQDFRAFQMIIVIDGAPEMEAQVRQLVQGDFRVQILMHDRNQGVAQALNTGFRQLFRTRGIEYLTWVSSDNVYYPSFLRTLRNTLIKGPEELGLVYSSFQSIDNDNKPLNNESQLAALRQYQAMPKEKLLDACIVGVSFMYKSRYARMIDGYELVPVEDYDYWLRLTEHCEMKYVPVELMDYRVNSTFSVSAGLGSVDEHRRWRYTYHLARHKARSRRGIAPVLTVLYPLAQASAAAANRIENLYEQTFSNYVCYVLDLSPGREVTSLLSTISHPSTDFKRFAAVDEASAIMYAAQMIQTPYTLVLGSRLFAEPTDVDILIAQMNKAGGEVCSAYYNDTHTDVSYRAAGSPLPNLNLRNELFRTSSLNELFKLHG